MSYTVLCKKCNYVSYVREAQEKSKVNGSICYHNFETIDIDFVDLVHEFGDYGRVDNYFQCKHCERLFNTIDDKNNHHILDRCLKDSISVNLAHAYDKLFRPEIYFSFFNYVNNSKLLNPSYLDINYQSWKTHNNLTKLSYKTFMDDLYRLEEYLIEQGLPNFLVVTDNQQKYYTIDFDIFIECYQQYNTRDYKKICKSFHTFFSQIYNSTRFYKRTSIETMYESYRYYYSKSELDLLKIDSYSSFRENLSMFIDYLVCNDKPVFIYLDCEDQDKYLLDKTLFKQTYGTKSEKPLEKKRKREKPVKTIPLNIEETIVNTQDITVAEPQSNGYIYLLQEREFIKTGEPIYKLGKTTKTIQERLQGYPKGSRLILCIEVEDCHEKEKKLLDKFRREFKLRKDIGNEYFEGDKQTMMKYIR